MQMNYCHFVLETAVPNLAININFNSKSKNTIYG